MLPKRYWYVLATYIGIALYGSLIIQLILFYLFGINNLYIQAYTSTITFVISLLIILKLMTSDFKLEKQQANISIGLIIGWSFAGVFIAYIAQITAALIELFVFKIQPGSANTIHIVKLVKTSPIFFIVPALIGPILEELVFRKIIFGSLHKKMNFFFAAIISSVIFAAAHKDFSHLLIYTAMGLTFSFLYVQTKRIIVPIIVHMAMNSIVIFIQVTFVDIEKLERQLQNMKSGLILLLGG